MGALALVDIEIGIKAGVVLRFGVGMRIRRAIIGVVAILLAIITGHRSSPGVPTRLSRPDLLAMSRRC